MIVGVISEDTKSKSGFQTTQRWTLSYYADGEILISSTAKREYIRTPKFPVYTMNSNFEAKII